jgi:hypothetical protein
MNTGFIAQDFAVVPTASYNSAALIFDVLIYIGIIPFDWELVRSPIYSGQFIQFCFENGVRLISQLGSIATISTQEWIAHLHCVTRLWQSNLKTCKI